MNTILLTANAATDNLSLDDYRAIYDELRDRGRRSLRDYVELIASAYSIAWWSKWENGDLRLTRAARNELRRAVSLPELPAAVSELLSDPTIVSPGAAVWRIIPLPCVTTGEGLGVGVGPGVGAHPATRVVLIGDQPTAIDIHVNSDVAVFNPQSSTGSDVTSVTRPQRRAARKSYHLCPGTAERFNSVRQDAALSIDAFVNALLDRWTAP